MSTPDTLTDWLEQDPTAATIPMGYLTLTLHYDEATGGLRARNPRGDYILASEADQLFALMLQFYAAHPDEELRPPIREVDKTPTPGVVYLLRMGQQFKIGLTRNLQQRLQALRQKCHADLELIHSIPTLDPRRLEAFYHSHFASKRINGEWFRLDEEDVQAFIAVAQEQPLEQR